ncbi:extracellular solute-binding protein [Gulosibacter macacae]|uniref:Extracellular solute-binding protein n=1 Tax=Gulosibacter macacae TaxID=2488791 RepID=A0A3P3VX19_9MICO|nr:extracellular solute-binding protein [Gulosibacter macacae]RRJ87004.1 extracellular solute-binding protein [Gulosibacter macacae]
MKKLTKIAALAAVSALALTGCAGGGGGTPGATVPAITSPTLGSVPADILAGQSITFAGDGGTTQDAMMSAWFTPFSTESGVTFAQDSPQTLAKIESQVNSGNIQWDFVSSYADTIERHCGTLFEELDMSKIDTSKVPSSVPVLKCGVPSIVYGVNIVYNTDTFGDNGPTTWADFFDTEKFPGKRTFYNGDSQIDAPIVQGAAIASGWDPKTPFTAEWANKGLDLIETIADDVVFYGTGAAAQQMLESGEAVIGAVWTGRSLKAEQNGANLTATWNDWIAVTDYFAIVKGTTKSEIAYYAINYALGAEQQAGFTEATGYAPANVDSKPNVDEVTEKYLVTGEDKAASAVPVAVEFWADADAVAPLQDRWSAIIAGAA